MSNMTKALDGKKTYIGIVLIALSQIVRAIGGDFPEMWTTMNAIAGLLESVGTFFGGVGIVNKWTKANPQAK